jgi:hypothetical protein
MTNKDQLKLFELANQFTDFSLFLSALKKEKEYPLSFFSEYPETRLKSFFYINLRFPELKLDFDRFHIIHPTISKMTDLAEDLICFDMYKHHNKVDRWKSEGYLYLSSLHHPELSLLPSHHYMLKPKFDLLYDTFYETKKSYSLFIGFNVAENTNTIYCNFDSITSFPLAIVNFNLKAKKLYD